MDADQHAAAVDASDLEANQLFAPLRAGGKK
jgi:hypothetical protein